MRTAVCLLPARLLAAGLLTLRLLAFRLLTFRLSTVRLSTVFPRDLLELLAQLVLLACELLELTLQLGLAHLPPLELLLLLEQLVLPPRELADLVERARARLIFLLRAGRRLVIGLLRPLQLLVEERRDVVIPVVIAGAARTGLLACHLPSLHIGLRLEEMIQRFHLRRQRVCSFEGIERGHGAAHGVGGRRHLVLLGHRLAGFEGFRRLLTAASARRLASAWISHGRFPERVRGLLDARLELGLGASDRPDVLLRLCAFGRPRSTIQFPRCDDDLFLRIDEIVDRAAIARAGHRLALRHCEFLLERLDLEEENVAARFARALSASEVARPRVVRHEIAGLNVEILEVQRPSAGDRRGATWDVERRRLLRASADGVDEVEAFDPIVVVGLGFDVDLVEPIHGTIARRLDDVDFGRPIFESANEIFGLARIRQPVAIGERDTIRGVVDDFERRRPDVRTGRQRKGFPVA